MPDLSFTVYTKKRANGKTNLCEYCHKPPLPFPVTTRHQMQALWDMAAENAIPRNVYYYLLTARKFSGRLALGAKCELDSSRGLVILHTFMLDSIDFARYNWRNPALFVK